MTMIERDPIVEVNLMMVEGDVSCWLLEAIDSDGGVHRAQFHGAYAEADARLWAGAAYPEVGFEVLAAPTRLRSPARAKLSVVGGTAALAQHNTGAE